MICLVMTMTKMMKNNQSQSRKSNYKNKQSNLLNKPTKLTLTLRAMRYNVIMMTKTNNNNNKYYNNNWTRWTSMMVRLTYNKMNNNSNNSNNRSLKRIIIRMRKISTKQTDLSLFFHLFIHYLLLFYSYLLFSIVDIIN